MDQIAQAFVGLLANAFTRDVEDHIHIDGGVAAFAQDGVLSEGASLDHPFDGDLVLFANLAPQAL